MSKTLVAAMSILTFSGTQILNAQQASTNVSSVLRSSLAAQIGGVPIQTVQLQGTVESIAGSDDETVPVEFEAVSSGSSRSEIDLSEGKLIEIKQSGGSGATGVWSNRDGKQHAMSGHNLMTDAAWWFPILIEERLLSDSSAIVSFVGIEEGLAHFRSVQTVPTNIPQSAADQVRHLSQVDLFLDYSTLLPSRLEFCIHPDNNALVDIPVIVQYSGYRSVSGATMPMHVQKLINNTLALDIQIQNATFNVSILSTDFTWQ